LRIAITAPSLSRDGGVERITCLVANALAAEGHDVAIITRVPSTFDHQPVSDSVQLLQLYVPRGPKPLSYLQLPFVVASLRRHVTHFRAQLVLGSRWDCAILSLLATIRSSVRTVVWEHVYLPYAPLTVPWRILRRLTYPNASALVLINKASVDAAQRLVDPSRIHVIPNFTSPRRTDGEAPPEEATAESRWIEFPGEAPEHKLLALGRLERQKGFDLLIEAYAHIADEFPDWGLLIVGRGSQRSLLEGLIRTYELHGHVHLAGPVVDPMATYRDSDAFVLSSRWEGFAMVLVEAMSAGLPVVAFDCLAGPGEIIRHEVDGVLVPDGDVGALSGALRRLMSDPDLRDRLARNATAIASQYSQESAMRLWSALLRSVVGDTTPRT
jgi:GalNAc-alpha-(1->4)-GalNAc-alpha-(1->3)-diNAcBac-PP-undecaprenol alpha-1,4-N-acetyl-D-galactosaminyltransferase